MFLRIFKHLLPNAKAWRLTANKKLRQFFDGLTELGSDIKEYVDLVWSDIFPQTTRELDAWEKQFGLPSTALTAQGRRDRLDGAWKALGGQSPKYIQDSLQEAGFDVYIHEWWTFTGVFDISCGEPLAVSGEPAAECGNFTGEVTSVNPVARDPSDVLTDGTIPFGYFLNSGGLVAVSGGVQAISGAANGVSGGLLVNKPAKIVYQIPSNPTQWRFILYIGAQVYGDRATVDVARREEFEALCLKLCPAQQWIGLIVEYS